jgi:undecaprenyl phosphate-alpha-L-ara4N flippase subunit ArnE
MTKLPLTLYALLFTTPVMIAFGQVLFKMTSQKLTQSDGKFYTVFFEPVFILAIVIYGSATLLWLYVLKAVPLAYAYSFMALTFLAVPLMAALWLGETLTIKYALGSAFIIAGLVIVNS